MSKDYSSFDATEIVAVLAIGLCVLAFIGLLVFLVNRISHNDAAKIHRDQVVKQECLANGGQLISGNCIQLKVTK